jgi:PAS domain S-box-containing protein
MTLFEILRKDQHQHCQLLFKEVMKGKSLKNVETIFITNKGKKIFVSGNVTPIIEKGKFISTCAIFHDVTEEKLVRKKLEESQERYKQIIENTQEFIWEVDMNGLYKFVSPNIEDITGFSPEEVINKKHFYDLFDPSTKEKLKEAALGALKQGKPFKDFINKNKSKIGKSIWLNTSGVPIKNKQGKLIGYTGSDKNITSEMKSKEELEKEKELAEKYLNIAGSIIVALDKNGNITLINKKGANVLGYNQEELIGKNWFNTCLPKNIRAETSKIFKKIMVGKIKSVEYVKGTLLTKKGEERIVRWYNSEIKDSNNKIIGALSSGEDITIKIESEERYKALFESSRDAIMTLEPPKWLFTSGNSATVKLFACKDEKHFTSFAPPMLSPEFQPDGQESGKKAMEMIQTAMKKGSHFFEWTHKTAKGKEFPATVLLAKLKIGKKEFLQATVRDVTEQKKSEEEINKLSRVTEQSPALVVLTDRNGNIEFVNEKFTQTTGYTLEETKGKNPRVLKSGHTSKKDYENLWKTITAGKVWKGEFKNKKKNGEFYWASALISPITNEKGEVTNFMGIQEDITKRREAEEKLQIQIGEMKKFQEIATDREIKMIELKKEINTLLKKPKYKIVK